MLSHLFLDIKIIVYHPIRHANACHLSLREAIGSPFGRAVTIGD